MNLPLALAALLAAGLPLAAQGPSGSLTGPGTQPGSNPDGTLGHAPAILDGQAPGPNAPDGSLGGPILTPQQDGCVTLNAGGGTLSSVTFIKDKWFLHRVVAPRNMRVESFDFFCRMATGSSTVQTALFLESSGKPASSAARTATMSVNTSAGFRRSSLSSSYYMSRGRVFYIGYKIPSSGSFYVDLTGGANSTYYWGGPPTWSGPITTRKFAWRVNCYDPGSTWTFGTGCNTASSRGIGQGTYATGLNVDATSNDNTGWVSGGYFQHRIVAPRDMNVDGVSFLCHRTSAAAAVPVEMYLGNGSSSSPGTRVRTGTMQVGTSADWCRATWTPYFIAKGTVFYVGYVAPTNFRVSTDDGANTTYYYRSPSSSSFSGPHTTRKFGVLVHTRFAENENQLATANTTSSFIRGAAFMHRHIADSDQWVSGFGFLCRLASGSATVRFELRLAGRDGKPLASALRAVNRTVSSSSNFYDVHFTPALIPRGAIYYVGYIVPSSTSVTLYPRATGSSTYSTSYYWAQPSSTSWTLYSSYAFARRIYSTRTQLNPGSTSLASGTYVKYAYFVFKATAPENMWIDGFELVCNQTTGTTTIPAVLYLANGSGGSPGSLARTSTMAIDASSAWRHSTFDRPYYVSKGTSFFVGLRTPNTSAGMRLRLNSGVSGTYFWRPATQSSWNGGTTGFQVPFGLKVHGRTGVARLAYGGTPELGQALQVKLVGASTSRVYGMVFGTSSSSWGPITLPWDIPFWSGCQLHVSYDSVLATGSTGSSGSAIVTIPIPVSPNLIHIGFYNQFWVLERTGSGFEMSWTNGGGVRIGG